jgi:branched-subunit amino acid aminotransferase/4-amino-4-deoxychorismate lyase
MRLPAPGSRAWIDGRVVEVGGPDGWIGDPGCVAGVGLFETIAVRAGCVLDLAAHLERLAGAAPRLGVTLPPRAALLATIEAAAAQQPDDGWVKLVVTRGGRWVVTHGALDAAEEGRPARAIVLPWRRPMRDPLAGTKSLSRASDVLALEEARRRGADEGLWLNARGRLVEATTSNVFVVLHGRVLTPATGEGALAGIVRSHALALARELGANVHEGRVRLPRLLQAREAFLTSSLRGIRPLVMVDRRPIGSGEPGPLTRRLQALLGNRRQAFAFGAP